MSKQWIKAAGIRAVKTIAQTAVATIGTAAALGGVDWKLVASASVLSGILSILTSVAGIPEAEPVIIRQETAEELSNGRGEDDE